MCILSGKNTHTSTSKAVEDLNHNKLLGLLQTVYQYNICTVPGVIMVGLMRNTCRSEVA